MRLLRAADQLNQLDTRVRAKRALAGREREAERALQQRERACAQREYAAYALMFDGPPPATGDETDFGVAPI